MVGPTTEMTHTHMEKKLTKTTGHITKKVLNCDICIHPFAEWYCASSLWISLPITIAYRRIHLIPSNNDRLISFKSFRQNTCPNYCVFYFDETIVDIQVFVSNRTISQQTYLISPSATHPTLPIDTCSKYPYTNIYNF